MAGRPSNNAKVENNKNDSNQELDIKSLIQQAVLEATNQIKNEYENKISELESKLNSQETITKNKTDNKIKPSNNKVRLIPDNTKIRIKSNISGQFYFFDDKGRVRVSFQIDGQGQSILITYEELNVIVNSTSGANFLKNGTIAITEVYSDEDITFEDVIYEKRLDKLYFDENKISPKDIEDLFYDDLTSEKEFERKVNNTPELLETILETAYVLYKRGMFSNNNKMNLLRQLFRKPELFK